MTQPIHMLGECYAYEFHRVSAANLSSKGATYGGEIVLVTCLDSLNPNLPVLAIEKTILATTYRDRNKCYGEA